MPGQVRPQHGIHRRAAVIVQYLRRIPDGETRVGVYNAILFFILYFSIDNAIPLTIHPFARLIGESSFLVNSIVQLVYILRRQPNRNRRMRSIIRMMRFFDEIAFA